MATAINIEVAMKHFKIPIKSVMTMAEVWYKQWPALDAVQPRIAGLPRFHSDIHLGWLGKPASYCAARVQDRIRSQAFKELSEGISASGVLNLDSRTIYDGFKQRLPDDMPLHDFDAPLEIGSHSEKMTEAQETAMNAFLHCIDDPLVKEELNAELQPLRAERKLNRVPTNRESRSAAWRAYSSEQVKGGSAKKRMQSLQTQKAQVRSWHTLR
ncbi:hypothetical protein LTR37_004568 [Vermiconidia calcicola]|uniref:Uncharacterized protein n=1 Tax=Vermiconidia calcicola TaxID=1690605 RepID=A0ACC3NML5_9PEZI|nr:hypothetical protein LTR37_004568 [Vermiconidia calcicola]